MKKVFITLTLVLTMMSCSTDNDVKISDSTANITKADEVNPKLLAIIEDQNFKDYMIQEADFLINLKDPLTAQEILDQGDSKKGLTPEESTEFAHNLGFGTYLQYHEHVYKQQQRLLTLEKDHGMLSLPSADLTYVLNQGYTLYITPVHDPNDPVALGGDCLGQYNNCKMEKGFLYFAGATACLGGGTVVTAASAGTLTAGAAWLAGLCLTANAGLYHTGLRGCRYSYNDCMNK